jgi:hypothetical protein
MTVPVFGTNQKEARYNLSAVYVLGYFLHTIYDTGCFDIYNSLKLQAVENYAFSLLLKVKSPKNSNFHHLEKISRLILLVD